MDKQARDHHANQKNPNSQAYKAATDNRANMMNPNNSAYESSRQGSRRKFACIYFYLRRYFKAYTVKKIFC